MLMNPFWTPPHLRSWGPLTNCKQLLVWCLRKTLHTWSAWLHSESVAWWIEFWCIWVCLGITSIPIYRAKHTFNLKNSNFACAGFQEKFNTPPLNPESSSRKLNSLPTKLCMHFSAHLQARELCPQTYSLSLPLEWSQATHIPTSIKLGRAYKPKKSAFYSTFARQLCDDMHPSSRMALCLSSTLTNIHAHSGKLCTHK